MCAFVRCAPTKQGLKARTHHETTKARTSVCSSQSKLTSKRESTRAHLRSVDALMPLSTILSTSKALLSTIKALKIKKRSEREEE